MSFYKINPEHRRAIGCGDATILYVYLEWRISTAGKEFTRKDEQIANDVGFTVNELRTVRKNLVNMGLVSLTRKGSPPVLYYSVHPERLAELVACPVRKERKQRDAYPPKVKGKFAKPNVNNLHTSLSENYSDQREQITDVNVNKLQTLTSKNYAQPPIYSIDTVVDKYTDSGESDFFEPDIQYFEKPKPANAPLSDEPEVTVATVTKPPIPNAKVFELSEFERDELLKNLTVGPMDLDWLLWLFDQERPTRAIEVALLNIRGADKVLFEKNTALYVLYAGESRWRKNLTGYLFEKKYLETPTDRRPKPKETKHERETRQHLEGIARTNAEIQRLIKLRNGH